MAISWDTRIINVNVEEQRGTVIFTRNDDAASPTQTFQVRYVNTSLKAEDRIPLLNTAWAKWQKAKTKQDAVDAFLSNLEQQANDNLNAREV
jgi:hypothetical protein